MSTRRLALISTATLFSAPLGAQRVSPVAVTSPTSSVRTISAAAAAQRDDPFGRGPFVVLGALVGAGAVTAYWAHEMSVSAKQNGDDGFIIPPIVFITIGAGGLGGGLLGVMIHDGLYN